MEQKRRDNKAIRQTGIDASTRRAHARTRRCVPFRGSRRDERIRDGECRMTSSDHVARGGKKKKETEVFKDHGDRSSRIVDHDGSARGVCSSRPEAIVNRFRNPLFEFPSSITFVTITNFVTWLIVETAGSRQGFPIPDRH